MTVEIESERFLMRELGLGDVGERYLGWLREPDAKKYIAAAAVTTGLEDLRRFVLERANRHDVLFFGIFDRSTGVHIGNIKFEPVDSELGYAIMGVLIGDPAYRGTGVTPEVLRSTAAWLKKNRGINEIVLGVSRDNRGAIRAYEKAGFSVAPTPYIQGRADTLTMVWKL